MECFAPTFIILIFPLSCTISSSELDSLLFQLCFERAYPVFTQNDVIHFFLLANPCGLAGKTSTILERTNSDNLAV